MKNKKYNILLAEVMLLPFTQVSFINRDPLLHFIESYDRLLQEDTSVNYQTMNKKKSDFANTKKELIDCLVHDYRWGHYDEIWEALNVFFPPYRITQYYDRKNKDIGKFYIQYIFEIAKVFITFRDGLVSIRNWSKERDPFLYHYDDFEKIDLWNNLSRTATVDLFIAATYVNFNVDIDSMYNIPNLIYLADMPLKGILKQGVAETHLHANAGLSYQRIWEKEMTIVIDNERCPELWFCALFRLYAAMYIEELSFDTFEEYIYKNNNHLQIIEWFKHFLKDSIESPSFEEITELKKSLIRNRTLNITESNGSEKDFMNREENNDPLFQSVYSNYQKRGTSAEIYMYVRVLNYLNQKYDRFLCDCLLTYIRYKNDYFKDKIQKTVFKGLDYFRGYYNNATDTLASRNRGKYYHIFEEQCRTGNLNILEIKVTPFIDKSSQLEDTAVKNMKKSIIKKIKQITGDYQRYIMDQYYLFDKGEKQNVESEVTKRELSDFRFPKLGIIYHFIKQDDSDNFNGKNCSVYDRSDSIDCADYNTTRKNCIRFLEALNQVFYEYPVLTDYVVGIDAASLENATEPWVFAPVFRRARTSRDLIPYASDKGAKGGLVQNIGFTYHVGEDFRHIVSGLRHIDEVLEHFDYRTGDRLGHAIALGVDIDNLVSQNSMVALLIMEYLENLLWMWQTSHQTNTVNAPSHLEFKIMEVARQIYHDHLGDIDVYTLWRVYQSKFNIFDSTYMKMLAPEGICSLSNKMANNEKWSFEELLCSHYCPCFYEIYHRPIFVSTDENVEFYKELQKYLIRKVEHRGIYVETNPTSNAAIGDIPSILNHPIIRLNNRGLHISGEDMSSILTSINSDDPIVFSTFVENEIAYIYYSLLNAGCSREIALEWIDKIRRHGINSSFIKHNKGLKDMLMDFDIISGIEA